MTRPIPTSPVTATSPDARGRPFRRAPSGAEASAAVRGPAYPASRPSPTPLGRGSRSRRRATCDSARSGCPDRDPFYDLALLRSVAPGRIARSSSSTVAAASRHAPTSPARDLLVGDRPPQAAPRVHAHLLPGSGRASALEATARLDTSSPSATAAAARSFLVERVSARALAIRRPRRGRRGLRRQRSRRRRGRGLRRSPPASARSRSSSGPCRSSGSSAPSSA